MRIAYITLDDVNRFMLRRWAEQNRLRVECPSADQLPTPVHGADAVVVDLDFLPAALREIWLARLLADALPGRAMVHGHNITDAEAAALRRKNVRICRGLLRRRHFNSWVRDLLRRCQATVRAAAADRERTGVGMS